MSNKDKYFEIGYSSFDILRFKSDFLESIINSILRAKIQQSGASAGIQLSLLAVFSKQSLMRRWRTRWRMKMKWPNVKAKDATPLIARISPNQILVLISGIRGVFYFRSSTPGYSACEVKMYGIRDGVFGGENHSFEVSGSGFSVKSSSVFSNIL